MLSFSRTQIETGGTILQSQISPIGNSTTSHYVTVCKTDIVHTDCLARHTLIPQFICILGWIENNKSLEQAGPELYQAPG